ncbi:MAG: ATP-dependent metallopeptidase FtsH/Yme1/Tma family protein, partial [Flavobacteriaceae bacterium]
MSNNPMNNNTKKKPSKYGWIFYAAILVFVAFNLFGGLALDNQEKTTTSQLEEYLREGDVDKIVIITNTRQAKVYLNDNALQKEVHKKVAEPSLLPSAAPTAQYVLDFGDLQNFENTIKTIKSENNLATVIDYDKENNYLLELLISILPFVLIIGVWIFLMRRMSGGSGAPGGGQIFSIGKSKAKLFDEKTDTRTSFKDVAGLEGAKEEVQEIVEFLKNPEKYTSLGGKIPKGALLVGPPGTGKTLLAKAVAGEAKVPFFSLSGSDFVEMFVGVGASRVRDLFKQAKDKSPAIIFIDEIDAIGRARGKNNMTGSNDERENTLNQLLTEMDGFGTNTNVIVLAATNRADVLDKALMRAGRFDRQIYVDLPDLNERKEIFEVHLKPIKTSETLDLEFLARQTPGFSGADIA